VRHPGFDDLRAQEGLSGEEAMTRCEQAALNELQRSLFEAVKKKNEYGAMCDDITRLISMSNPDFATAILDKKHDKVIWFFDQISNILNREDK
jgi:hypothetical protein